MTDIKDIRKFVRTSLGEPVVVAEIQDENIDAAFEQAKDWWVILADWDTDFDQITEDLIRDIWIKKMTLAISQHILGCVRSKFGRISVPVSGEMNVGDGGIVLIENANRQQEYLLNYLENM